jgi:type VI protein secretion system component Hcp
MSKINHLLETCQQCRQADELTEFELGNITGGKPSSGAGAGKVPFNAFSITRQIDKASPVLF